MWERDKLLRHDDYVIEVEGISILIKDKVFSPDPRITQSSNMLLKHLPNVSWKEVLDIWCWTGIVWLTAAKKGAKRVVCSDVDMHAILNAKENVASNNLQNNIEVLQSNLFDALDWKFDYIFANLPILDEVWNSNVQKNNSTSTLIQRFLREKSKYLSKNWKTYLTRASFADIEPLYSYFKSMKLDVKEIKETKAWYDRYIFEILSH